MKKILAILLCVLMLFSMLPVSALAEESGMADAGENEPVLSGDQGDELTDPLPDLGGEQEVPVEAGLEDGTADGDTGSDQPAGGDDTTGQTGGEDAAGTDGEGNGDGTQDGGGTGPGTEPGTEEPPLTEETAYATAVRISAETLSLDALETATLYTNVEPYSCDQTVTWSSSDTSVAIVTQTGLVTAIGKGTAVITATATATSETGEPVSATCTVTVRGNAILALRVSDLESEHPYAPNENCFWLHRVSKADAVQLVFDEQSRLAEGDFLTITDGNGTPLTDENGQELRYTGDTISGLRVTVPSDTFRIYLVSDEDGQEDWGFRVAEATAISSGDDTLYTVRYYANGGVNAPKDQTGVTLPFTLSEEEPTRQHYTFEGWATDRDSGATYQPGELVETLDENTLVGNRLDLFAVWERVTTPGYNYPTTPYSGPENTGPVVTDTTPDNPLYVEREEAEYDKDVLHIRTVEDLLEFAENCALDTWSDRLPVVLDNDLSLSGVDFWAIPFFNGSFNGLGHTIYDVTLTDSLAPCGFFLETGPQATIKNLSVSGNVAPGGDSSMTGGLVGQNRGLLLNCAVSGTVTGSKEAGGVVGRNEATGIISDCRSSCSVLGMSGVGGIAGHNLGAITNCESSSLVNTESVDPGLDTSALDTSSVLNFIHSLTSDAVGVTEDIGGIVGFNEGFVEDCTARQSVGYQHLGYNVGGIAGRSDGYISGCTSEAEVNGRRDVGGIVGQAEPYIEITEDNSIVADLSYRVYALHQAIESAARDAAALGQDISNQLDAISEYVEPLRDAMTGFDVNNPSEEAIEQIRAAMVNMTSGVSGELESMSESVGEGSTVLSADMMNINDNISALSGTAIQSAQLISSTAGKTELEDISVTEAESELALGKVTGCTNRGTVNGDRNVGGVVGCMSVENEFDPDTDLTGTDFLVRKSNRFRIVVSDCLNDGPIAARYECAGGIAGKTDIGYITRSVAYNSISMEDGAYVGGIAGLSYGTVQGCVAKCSLAGNKYVGGILGNGHPGTGSVDEPSLVSNCYTLVEIADRPQFSGAISGGGEGNYTENYFVPSGYAGLNRRSVQNQAEPVVFSVFSSLSGLPEESKHFTLRFVVEGETVKEVPFEYGDSFGRSVYPEVPERDGAYAVWDNTDLTDLRFDTVVTAIYRRSATALKSDLVREDGRAAVYVIGQFQQDDSVHMEIIPEEEGAVEQFRSGWFRTALAQLRSVLNGEPDYSIPVSVKEHISVSYPDDGEEIHTIHYLSPDYSTENIRVYQRNGDAWERLKPEVFGSYLSVLSAETEPELCFVETMQSWWILLWAAGAVLVLILLIALIRLIRKILRERPPKPVGTPGSAKGWLRAHRKPLIILSVILLVGVLAVTAVLQSGRLRSGIAAIRMLQSFYNEETDIQAELRLLSGEEESMTSATLHRVRQNGRMITCTDQYGIPIYIADGKVYLENGRSFRLLDSGLDSGRVLRFAVEAFRRGSVTALREENSVTYTADLEGERITEILRSVTGSDSELLSTFQNAHMTLATENGSITSLHITADGDEAGDRFEVMLRPSPLTGRPVIPQTVLDAMASSSESAELLTDDFMALLAAWIRYDRKEAVDASVSVSADAGILSMDDRYSYFRRNLDGTDIHAIESRLFSVYFTDKAACTETGSLLGDGESRLLDAASLIAAARELCLEGDFQCETSGNCRVYTLTVPAENIRELMEGILPDFRGLNISYEECTLTVTLLEESLDSMELKCGGTMKIVTREIDASADVIIRSAEVSSRTIPMAVQDALLG